MEDILLTYTDINLMIENSNTYLEMNNMEKLEFLKEFVNRYDIGGVK